MFTKPFRLTVRVALLAGFLCLPTLSALAASAVRDEGSLLSPAAESEAFKLAREIEDRTKLDVIVETVARMPDDVRSKYDARPDQHGAVVREWAVGRARQAGVGGVYVLIIREPGAFELLPTKAAAALLPDSSQASSAMRAGFKAGEFDRGLIDGLTVMRDKMAPAAGAATPVERSSTTAAPAASGAESRTAPGASTSSGGGGISTGSIIMLVVLGLVVVFVIRKVLGAGRSQQQQQFGYGQPGSPGGPPPMPGQGGYDPRYGGQYGQPQQQQGGGFGRGLAGGLLGGIAGSYLYGQIAGGNQSHAAPADPNALGGSDPSGGGGSTGDEFAQGSGGTFDSPSSDFSGGGGDFGGGGSDFGDSGGGDF